jgi:group II intron reverse transcriptase/maturase
MQEAKTVLAVIQERGKRGLPLKRVYRHLFNRELYLIAYGNIYRNAGAMTPGSSTETIDGMSLAKIDAIIEALRYERYQWKPARRVYIPKKNGKKRPLGVTDWSDKLLQEVIRLILEAYYEPQFSDHSHGFRPERGCHTAIREIKRNWLGTTWFIEGDIKACFDTLNHEILLKTLAENIQDGRFIQLMQKLLEAGYMEEWHYNRTYSGTPQGGVISPLLSNIYLDKLDKYIETTLIPAYTKGLKRKLNTAYTSQMRRVCKLRKQGRKQEARQERQKMLQLPSVDPNDPDYRRLKYVRYADDWLIGFIGTKEEAEEIKQQLKTFTQDVLKLTLSEEKTLITHARTKAARFLSYEISTNQADEYQPKGGRYVNGKIKLRIPEDVLRAKYRYYLRKGKPRYRKEMIDSSEYDIVSQYQSEFRGFVEYYRMASNLLKCGKLKWIMEQSLTRTLSFKSRRTVVQVYEKYRTTKVINGYTYKVLQVVIPRKEKKPLVAIWGGVSLKTKVEAILKDQLPVPRWNSRTELVQRLLADTCELCGSQDRINVHHIRALKDLNLKGRREKPDWMKAMIARRRKTLMVCWSCHMDIHHGKYMEKAKEQG